MQLSFHKAMSTTTKIIPKKDFQIILRSLRNVRYTVEKLDAGYQAYTVLNSGKKLLVLKAMNGNRGYLATYDANLFE